MSLQPGQYTNPLIRPAFIEAPIVASYATARLRADLQFNGTGTCPSIEDNLISAVLENVGATTATVQLRQVGDYASGLPTNGTLGTLAQTTPYRSNLTAAFTLVPGGRKVTTFTPRQQYIELWGVSGGPAQMRMQLATMVPLTELAFAKDDPTYPPQLWEPPSLANT